VAGKRIDLLLYNRVNAHNDIGLKGIWLLEVIPGMDDHGHGGHVRDVGNDVGHGEHVRCILHKLRGVAMVGVIVVGAVDHDQVGPEFTRDGDDQVAIFQRGQQRAVVDIERDVLDAEDGPRGGGFGATPPGQWGPALGVMACIAIGQADHLHAMAEPGVERGHAASGEVGVVGVSADDQDVQGAGFSHDVAVFSVNTGRRTYGSRQEPV